MTTSDDSTTRFSHCVDDYVRYRPGYPDALVTFLCEQADLGPRARVADIGAGSGALTRLLLPHARSVIAVEPNAPMRAAADRALADLAESMPVVSGQVSGTGYRSVDGTAERTTLADHSVDLVVAAQAFHWFEPDATRREWQRVLTAGGQAVLVWNRRDREDDPFMREYDALLHDWIDGYAALDHARIDDAAIAAFYGQTPHRFECLHVVTLDLPALEGRLRSASYCPTPRDASYRPFMQAMRRIFLAHARNGQVPFIHRTVAFAGPLPELRPG